MKMRVSILTLAVCCAAVPLTVATAQRPQSPGVPDPSRATAEKALIDELVLANRMLASEQLGVLDGLGHVSVRSRTSANRF